MLLNVTNTMYINKEGQSNLRKKTSANPQFTIQTLKILNGISFCYVDRIGF